MKKAKLETVPKTVRGDHGFTLIEVLVAIALLSFGILALTSSINSVIKYNDKAGNVSTATLHTTNKIEELKRMATNEPTGGTFGYNYFVQDYPTAESMTASGNQKYTKTYTIGNYSQLVEMEVHPSGSTETFDDPTEISRIKLTVTTSWTADTGEPHNVSLATILHRRQFVS